jgi:tetratricopeptide (TPR) repeat protein
MEGVVMPAQSLENQFKQLNDQYPEKFGKLDGWNYDTEEVLSDLLRALRRKKGFGLFFVQCNSAQTERIMTSIRQQLPQKRLQQFDLSRDSETLYGEILESYQQKPFAVAYITGVEQVLFGYEDTKRLAGWTSQEIYNYSWKGVPSLLSHLNRQREAFEANLPIALVFLVRSFVIDYFIQRAPDFFDWRSGFFKFSKGAEDLQKASQELVGRDYQEYLTLTPEQRMEKLLEIKDQIRQLDPNENDQKSNLLREQGRLFESGEDSIQALDCYNRSLSLSPKNYSAWADRGDVLHDLDRYEEAIESYDKALYINLNDHYSWTGRGNTLRDLGRYEEAIESFNKALEIESVNPYIWDSLGDVFLDLDRNKEAIESYDKVLKIMPDYYHAWSFRGLALGRLGHHEEAIKSCNKALEIKSDYYFAWSVRGDALHYLGHNEQAIESYNKLLEIEPDYHYAWTGRGNSLCDLGRYEEAIESYDHSLENQSDFILAWIGKGISLYQLGKCQEASGCFTKVVNIQPCDKISWNNQGYLNLTQDSYGLESIFEKPLLIHQHQDCGGSLTTPNIDLERYQSALAGFETALQLDPEYTLAWANCGFPNYYLRQYEAALYSCDRALELDPDNNEEMNEVIYTNRGFILLQLQNPTAAVQDFNTALALDPHIDKAYIGKGTALFYLGRYAEARHSFSKALAFNHPLVQVNLDLVQQHLSVEAKLSKEDV